MKKISKARFEALSYARVPLVKLISEDIEWYSNDNNAVLGAILLDKIDNDYVAMVLGRDEAGVFRCIDAKVSTQTIAEAREVLLGEVNKHSKNGAKEFPQGVITRKKNMIFEYIEKKEPMTDDYKLLSELDLFTPAKELIAEIAYSFEDPDGNYIEQFQSKGFNARLWELYLYAFLHESDFEINRDYNAPDYVVEKHGMRICIEAVTVNPSQHKENEGEPKNDEEKKQLLKDYMPIKYGSSLYSKLQKKYWEKEHVSGHPLVIAIHDYHQKNSMMWSRPALETYLYGATRTVILNEGVFSEEVVEISEHRWKEKIIPSGFFKQPGSENISAIIHSNQATIGKFLRMGYLAEFGDDGTEIGVSGEAIFNDASVPEKVTFRVERGNYDEYWHESIVVFHNPNAKNPLDPSLFPNVMHINYKDGEFLRIMPGYFPLHVMTHYRERDLTENAR